MKRKLALAVLLGLGSLASADQLTYVCDHAVMAYTTPSGTCYTVTLQDGTEGVVTAFNRMTNEGTMAYCNSKGKLRRRAFHNFEIASMDKGCGA